jgi:hypothetical protein
VQIYLAETLGRIEVENHGSSASYTPRCQVV